MKIQQLTINGVKQQRKVAGFALELLSPDIIRIYGARYDRDGIIETPVYRCVYHRSF